uniref:DUF3179 domain-containing protein n=1 Tax=uncultured microorganism TaxID=358574 RepID=F8U8W7_9ZZZZ|nr:hypothetical protein [uncultured microorganism]
MLFRLFYRSSGMAVSEWMTVLAALLCAVAVLPGTLGFLMLTHKIAANASGARFIYGRSVWVLAISFLLLAGGIYNAITSDGFSMIALSGIIVYAGILLFGFFMHTTLMFKPVRRPEFISIEGAMKRFGPDEEVVGVIDQNGKPHAFVARLARRPHVVYQPEGDAPFIMTHCILAHSSMSYALEGAFSAPDISISAVLANNMVFYDKSSQCSVIQIQNQARDSDMSLQTVATVTVLLSTWQSLYPESRVWVRPKEWRDIFYLKLLSRADVIDAASPVMVYALQNPLDERLPMKSLVLGVRNGADNRTYPASVFAHESLINDRLGDKDLLLVAAFDNDYLQVFDRQIKPGTTLVFKPSSKPDYFLDTQTGSEWSPQGQCTSGNYGGQQLRPFAHYNKMFWYVWADFFPGTDIYTQEQQIDVSKTASKMVNTATGI